MVKLDSKILNGILKKALNFVYAGENERPVNQLNFRNKAQGGLGLINPIVKARHFWLRIWSKICWIIILTLMMIMW